MESRGTGMSNMIMIHASFTPRKYRNPPSKFENLGYRWWMILWKYFKVMLKIFGRKVLLYFVMKSLSSFWWRCYLSKYNQIIKWRF